MSSADELSLERNASATKWLTIWTFERISNVYVWFDKDCFDKAAPDYNNALKNSGFNENTKFTPQPPQGRKRRRNILWFSPPFSSNVKINPCKIFLQLLDKHFPKHHKYYKLFNGNNIKKSYSCMQNKASFIQNHFTNLLKDAAAPTAKGFSCRQKSNYPLSKKCLSACLVYRAQDDRSDIDKLKLIVVLTKKIQRTLQQPYSFF